MIDLPLAYNHLLPNSVQCVQGLAQNVLTKKQNRNLIDHLVSL